jgi:hypothetical protein
VLLDDLSRPTNPNQFSGRSHVPDRTFAKVSAMIAA